MISNSHYIYCHTIFLTAESYGQHLLKKHALPVWDGIETTSSAAPTESAFTGKLRRYDLKVGEKEMGLLQVMMQNKEEIDALILERVKEGPNKVLIPRGSGNDQNSHCARRGQWKLRKDHAVSQH